MNRRQFAFAIGKARTEDERLAWFGALLTRESKLEGRLIIVGGSAIEIYLTSSKYVSMDIGVVGDKKAIAEVLSGMGVSTGGGARQQAVLGEGGPRKRRSGRADRSFGASPTNPHHPVWRSPSRSDRVFNPPAFDEVGSGAFDQTVSPGGGSCRAVPREAWIGSTSNRSRSPRESYPSTINLGSKFTRADQDEVGELPNPPFGRASARAHSAKG